jgi:uncharacterized membrane protein
MGTQVHHRRAAIHTRSLGESLADAIAEGMGSWRFIIIQSAIVLAWIGANLWLLSRPYDAYPFILLNLLFSTQAAYAAPVIMMSQNRQASKDRKRDDAEATEVDDLVKLLQQNTALTEQVAQLTREVHSAISGQPLVKWPAMPTNTPPVETMTGRARDPKTGHFLKRGA